MRRTLAIVVVLLVLAAGFFIASPYLALGGLRDAFESGDAAELEGRIDFPVLRENLKLQLSSSLSEQAQGSDSKSGAFGALAAGLANMVLAQVVDSIATPDGLARLIASGSPGEAAAGKDPETQRQVEQAFENARLEWDGLDRVSLWVPSDDGRESRLVLQRSGLHWKLTNVEPPRG